MDDARLPAGPPVTSLRVYEPIEAFPAAERAGWTDWVAAPPSEDDVVAHERRAVWRQVVRPRPLHGGEQEPRMARVLDAAGTPVLCPVQLPLRMAAAAREAARTLPPALVAVVPAGAPGGEAGPDDDPAPRPGTGSDPDVRLRTLVAVWDIPWAWLALVRPGERRHGSRPGDAGRYVVPMAAARSRAARALRVLRDGGSVAGLGGEVESVARWLEDFHPRSLVEVDDAEVAALLDDDGAEDVRLGLEALEAGEVTAVAAAYRRLARRGERLRLLSRAS